MYRLRVGGRLPAILSIVVLVGACSALVSNAAEPTPAPSARSAGSTWSPATAAPSAIPAAPSTPTTAPAATFAPSGRTETALVTRVIDGDTIEVEIDGALDTVRYIGMDTPETVRPGSPVEWMGPEATAANAGLVDGRTVVLERDVSDRDGFDRLLRYVWLTDGATWTLVNAELVRRGVASVATYPPDVKYTDLLLAEERAARDLEVGLWGPVPTPEPSPSPTPTPETVDFSDDSAISITADTRPRFDGTAGDYTWTGLFFEESRMVVRWGATASSSSDCRVVMEISPDSGEPIKRSVRVPAGGSESDNARHATPFAYAELAVTSTCPTWRISMQGEEPPPTPRPATGGGGGGSSCHPSYRGACLDPNASDYDCAGGSGNGPKYTGTVTVVGYDEFDLDGDNDGLGCE